MSERPVKSALDVARGAGIDLEDAQAALSDLVHLGFAEQVPVNGSKLPRWRATDDAWTRFRRTLQQPWGNEETFVLALAMVAGLRPGQTWRLLHELEAEGLVQRNGDTWQVRS